MKIKRQRVTGFLFVSISLVGFGIFFLVPFLISIALSFSRTSGTFNFAGFQNYIALFKSGSFQLAFINTLRFVIIGVPILMLFSMTMALLFNYLNKVNPKQTAFWFVLSLLPMVVPSSAIVMFVQVMFEKYGVVNGIIIGLGGSAVNWMNSDRTIIILLMLYVWKNFSYNMVIILGAIKGIQKEVFEAAALDGASGIKMAAFITLPQIKSFLSFTVLLSVMGIFKMFRESYLLFGDYPHESVYMLQNFMNNNFYSISYQRLTTASIVFFMLVSIGIFMLIRKKHQPDKDC